MDIEFGNLKLNDAIEMGLWLDKNFPNPPLPESQRWTLGISLDGRDGVHFEDDQDAFMFKIAWAHVLKN